MFVFQRFMVSWNVFVREYPAAVGQPIDQELAKSLKNVLGIVVTFHTLH
jgi:hypothetical protein